MAKAAEGTRTLLVQEKKGRFKITIPESYKVTFGKLQPGDRDYGTGGNALRIYEAENKQRAVFVGVQSFRDLSLPVERERVAKSGSISWSQDDGNLSESRSESERREFEMEEV